MKDYGNAPLVVGQENKELWDAAEIAGFRYGAGHGKKLPKTWNGYRIAGSSCIVAAMFRIGRNSGLATRG